MSDVQASEKPAITAPFYPIIYVRGFAGSESEIDDTIADPYMGFNIGATKFRQAWTGNIRRHYFESPLYRLTKDFRYGDVYTDGVYMPSGMTIDARSVIVYRYYDEQFFDDLDDDEDDADPPLKVSGKARQIEDFAAGLGKLIQKVRRRICDGDPELEKKFKVNLVGHSMGGLIIRSFLQNIGQGGKPVTDRFGAKWEKLFKESRSWVDKVFTYATPHNGIDVGVIGNVPGFFTANDANNFNRDRMREYLRLPKWSDDRADNLLGCFEASRFFSLVGTNHQDYAVLYGFSRRLIGPASDGLVRIANATVHSQKTQASAKEEGPRAFVHRAHSGHFGIVNSEEGYQNLIRFLFGNVRVDGVLDIDELTLPEELEKAKEDGRQIRASYHFDVIVRTKGIDCDLHRRVHEEGSAIFRKYDDMFPNDGSKPRSPHLFSVFLSSNSRVEEDRPSLSFAVDLAVRVPEYLVDRKLWRSKSYKGSTLLDSTIYIEATAPIQGNEWDIKYSVDPQNLAEMTDSAALTKTSDGVEFAIPIDSETTPGLRGSLRVAAKPWA